MVTARLMMLVSAYRVDSDGVDMDSVRGTIMGFVPLIANWFKHMRSALYGFKKGSGLFLDLNDEDETGYCIDATMQLDSEHAYQGALRQGYEKMHVAHQWFENEGASRHGYFVHQRYLWPRVTGSIYFSDEYCNRGDEYAGLLQQNEWIVTMVNHCSYRKHRELNSYVGQMLLLKTSSIGVYLCTTCLNHVIGSATPDVHGK